MAAALSVEPPIGIERAVCSGVRTIRAR
jgi:hypothetical protein